MILKREEKEQLVIELAMKCKTTREIAQTAHVSLKDIPHNLILLSMINVNGMEYEHYISLMCLESS
jgi:PP-loop superfamily ATP-utilizing enzyme